MVNLKRSPLIPFVTLLMVVFMGVISITPNVQAGFIPTNNDSPQRAKDLAAIQKVLEHKMVKSRLEALGYDNQEIMDRLSKLSDQEVHKLASQMDSLKPGGVLGAIIAVLVIILLVLLILHYSGKKKIVIG